MIKIFKTYKDMDSVYSLKEGTKFILLVYPGKRYPAYQEIFKTYKTSYNTISDEKTP